MNNEPLFATEVELEPPMVPKVVFNTKIQWVRIVVLNKPTCGHCQMVIHSGVAMPVQRARWTRIAMNGSVLELCEGHAVHQRRRDSE